MKVLLLIIVISNPEAVCLNGTFFTREIVSSKEEAAMILKTKNTEKTDVYDDFAGKLYEVDLTNNTVKLITIPEIVFK